MAGQYEFLLLSDANGLIPQENFPLLAQSHSIFLDYQPNEIPGDEEKYGEFMKNLCLAGKGELQFAVCRLRSIGHLIGVSLYRHYLNTFNVHRTYVENFYISPAHRRRGAGRFLLKQIESHGKNYHSSEITLEIPLIPSRNYFPTEAEGFFFSQNYFIGSFGFQSQKEIVKEKGEEEEDGKDSLYSIVSLEEFQQNPHLLPGTSLDSFYSLIEPVHRELRCLPKHFPINYRKEIEEICRDGKADLIALVRKSSVEEAATIEIISLAVYRFQSTIQGIRCYVDDLVTKESSRSTGGGHRLLSFIKGKASGQGCRRITLESGVQRARAHRFYYREGLEISHHSFHGIIQ